MASDSSLNFLFSDPTPKGKTSFLSSEMGSNIVAGEWDWMRVIWPHLFPPQDENGDHTGILPPWNLPEPTPPAGSDDPEGVPMEEEPNGGKFGALDNRLWIVVAIVALLFLGGKR